MSPTVLQKVGWKINVTFQHKNRLYDGKYSKKQFAQLT